MRGSSLLISVWETDALATELPLNGAKLEKLGKSVVALN